MRANFSIKTGRFILRTVAGHEALALIYPAYSKDSRALQKDMQLSWSVTFIRLSSVWLHTTEYLPGKATMRSSFSTYSPPFSLWKQHDLNHQKKLSWQHSKPRLYFFLESTWQIHEQSEWSWLRLHRSFNRDQPWHIELNKPEWKLMDRSAYHDMGLVA